MAIDVKRQFVPYVVGLAPALLVILTWSPSSDWTIFKLFHRNFAAPIVGAELVVFLIAAREGLLKSLPRWNWSRPALIAILILVAIAAATTYFAPVRLWAGRLTAYWIIHGLFAVSILYLCGRLFQPADLIRAYLVGFAVFVGLLLIFLFQIPDLTRFDWKNSFLGFTHIRHAGYYTAAVAGLAIGVMSTSRSRGEWAFAFTCSSLAILIALWTGSRGAVLAVVAAFIAGLILVPAFRNLRGIGGGVSSLALAAAAASQLPVYHYLMGASRMVSQTASGDVTTGRTVLWGMVIDAIRQQPLFGYGEGQQKVVATFFDIAQAHNFFLQVALAWGLVGLAGVLVLAIGYARRAVPVVQSEDGAVVPAFMAMAVLAVLSLYDGSLYYALPQSIFAACGAIIASRWSASAHVRERSSVTDHNAAVPAAEG